MAYKTAQQKILIALIIATFFITVISGATWKMWSVVPITFFFLYLVGKQRPPQTSNMEYWFSLTSS